MRISVIGVGYLGAVHAACMAEIGHQVIGVDSDAQKVRLLGQGLAPFYEPAFDDILLRAVNSGALRFSTSLAEAADFADVHFICVGTPQLPGEVGADLSSIEAVIEGLAPRLTRDCLIAGKSTVPVGTAARLAGRVSAVAPAGQAAELAWNPEFLREGFAVEDTLRPDRVVVGSSSPGAYTTLREVYEPILAAGAPYIATDLPTAELVKVAANAFLATKISFINAVGDVCAAAGADIVTLSRALGHDPRIGPRFLSAGLGFGGGCLPKDIRAFIARAEELGVGPSLRFLREVDDLNQERRRLAVDVARDLVGGTFANRNVAVLGASFKPETDDVRDSPALAVATAIHTEGAAVRVHDPKASHNARQAVPALIYSAEAADACEKADIVLHLTEWREYQELDPSYLASVVRSPRILDGRSVLPLEKWRIAGWTTLSLSGAPSQPWAR